MTWHFETDPEFQKQLDWIDEFVREEIEPLDFIITSPYDLDDPVRNVTTSSNRCRNRYRSANFGRAIWDPTWVARGMVR